MESESTTPNSSGTVGLVIDRRSRGCRTLVGQRKGGEKPRTVIFDHRTDDEDGVTGSPETVLQSPEGLSVVSQKSRKSKVLIVADTFHVSPFY